MNEFRYQIPEGIFLNKSESSGLLNLAQQEMKEGALAFGVFGGRTLYGKNDIDIIVVKERIQRSGLTLRNGIFHLNYFPTNFLSDPIATFGKQAFNSAVFIYNYL
ncbi:hypothetical protein CANDROIZ_500007 [Candidatus Roizmanbacteria bacterium]|nr:hypothetical protein CANDROIZ_500007 [Candidatus Roizmanbacteria bacterium]